VRARLEARVTADLRTNDLADAVGFDRPGYLYGAWPAILRWMVEGCCEWQEIRLDPPAMVLEFSREYFRAQDPLAEWIEAKIERQPAGFASQASLFASWQAWCLAHREHEAMGPKRFTQRLESAGFKAGRSNTRDRTRGFVGINLRK
jgi:putative DNA primase/helicase